MFDKVVSDVFLQMILPNWKRSASYGVSPRLWLKTFVNVASETNIISKSLASSLAASPSMLRIMLNSFDTSGRFPSAREYAINIAFEISQPGFDITLENAPELWRLRTFAAAVRNHWLENISKSFVLQSRFESLYEIKPEALIYESSELDEDLDRILCHREKLASAYFEYYSTIDSHPIDNRTKVTIWLSPLIETKLHELSTRFHIIVNVDNNSGVQLGFFRQHFDYSIETIQSQHWLEKSSIDRSQALESAKFGDFQLGRTTNSIIRDRNSSKVA